MGRCLSNAKTICLKRCVFSLFAVESADGSLRQGDREFPCWRMLGPSLVEPTFGCICCATRRSLIYPLWQPTSCSHTGCPSQGITQVFVLRRDTARQCHETQHRMWVEPANGVRVEPANGVRWRVVAFGTIGATQCPMVVGSRCRRLLAD